jgi:hypothetical protein
VVVSGNSVSGRPVVVWSHIALSLSTGLVPRCGGGAVDAVLEDEQARRTA